MTVIKPCPKLFCFLHFLEALKKKNFKNIFMNPGIKSFSYLFLSELGNSHII